MLVASSLHQQYEQTLTDKYRVLIAGAGIAGITAAQMLRKDGLHPVLIERNTDNSHPGYMLALMPMVDPVLKDLDLGEHYRSRSVQLNRYGLHSHTGKLIREDSMADVLNRYGDYRGIARGELMEVLTAGGSEVTFDTIVTGMDQSENTCMVSFQTGSAVTELEFDLVIIADGIHSATRELLVNKQEINKVDTRCGGWVVWAEADDNMDLGEEVWGAGFFIGVYPVKGSLGVFLGGTREDTKAGPSEFVDSVRRKLSHITPRMESCLRAVTDTAEPYYWPLSDCRCPQWAFGRSLLLGDAAAGFLPTAGIGAGMAMESAWVLTRMLRQAQKANLPKLLNAYERSQRPRVETAQRTSRDLARLMFRKSKALAIVRDLAMRLVSLDAALKPIQKLLADQPDPDRIAKEALT